MCIRDRLSDPDFIPDSSNGVYITFLIIGIIGYFTIPTVSNWIVQAGGGAGNYGKNVNQAASKTCLLYTSNKFDEIQALLGLTDKERAQILSINMANNPSRKYKEVWIGLGGSQSAFYATEVSREEYMVRP